MKVNMRTFTVIGATATIALPRTPGIILLARELKTLLSRLIYFAKRMHLAKS
jgi:hypothetical protein